MPYSLTIAANYFESDKEAVFYWPLPLIIYLSEVYVGNSNHKLQDTAI